MPDLVTEPSGIWNRECVICGHKWYGCAGDEDCPRAELHDKTVCGECGSATGWKSGDGVYRCLACIDEQSKDWSEDLASDRSEETVSAEQRIRQALEIAMRYGGIDGDHHKAWCIDQMVRRLTGDDYQSFVGEAKSGEDGPETYSWNEGIPP